MRLARHQLLLRPLPWPWLVGVALLHLLPFAARPALIGGDEPHYALMAHSLAVDGDVDLGDDYDAVAAGSPAAGRKRAGQQLDRHLRQVGDRELFAHPLGLPLLVTPLLAVQQRLAPGSPPDLLLGLAGLALTLVALLAGCRLLERYTATHPETAGAGTALGLAVYFSSPLWYYSRTFFTEPYLWSFLVLATACVVAGRDLPAALFLALALAVKETALLLVAPLLLVAARLLGLRRAAVLAAGPAVFFVFFVGKNLLLTGEPLVTFQRFQVGSPLAGAWGLLTDPSHGLAGFAPLLLIAMAGWCFPVPAPGRRWITAGGAAAFVAYFALTACWIDWRGGEASYGPRLLIPALPVLALPLTHLWHRAGRSPALRWTLAAAFVAGFTVNWCAALDPVPALWGASISELLTAKPAATLAGIAVGTALWRAGSRRLLSRPPGFPAASAPSSCPPPETR